MSKVIRYRLEGKEVVDLHIYQLLEAYFITDVHILALKKKYRLSGDTIEQILRGEVCRATYNEFMKEHPKCSDINVETEDEAIFRLFNSGMSIDKMYKIFGHSNSYYAYRLKRYRNSIATKDDACI